MWYLIMVFTETEETYMLASSNMLEIIMDRLMSNPRVITAISCPWHGNVLDREALVGPGITRQAGAIWRPN